MVLSLSQFAPLDPAAMRAGDVLVVNEQAVAWLGNQLGTSAEAVRLHAGVGATVMVTLGSIAAYRWTLR